MLSPLIFFSQRYLSWVSLHKHCYSWHPFRDTWTAHITFYHGSWCVQWTEPRQNCPLLKIRTIWCISHLLLSWEIPGHFLATTYFSDLSIFPLFSPWNFVFTALNGFWFPYFKMTSAWLKYLQSKLSLPMLKLQYERLRKVIHTFYKLWVFCFKIAIHWFTFLAKRFFMLYLI